MYKVRYQEKDPSFYSNEKVTLMPGEGLSEDQIVEKLAEALDYPAEKIDLREAEEVEDE